MVIVHDSPNNYNNKIKDHWSQTTITNIIIMKGLKYCKNYQKWHRNMKWVNAVGRIASIDLRIESCYKPSVFRKYSKMSCAS